MTVSGIDVSRWQGDFDWNAWKGRIGFGMAKATEGTADTDPELGHDWNGMWELNRLMPRFAYHYFHASLDPVAQADHLIGTIRSHGLLAGDNLVLDLEETEAGSGRNDGVAPAVTAERAIAFLHRVNYLAPGHRVLVYTTPAFAQDGNCAGLDAWYLWVANYGVTAPHVPAPWKTWTFWQYTGEQLDGDLYNGDQASLLAFTRMPKSR